jgi:hypothetical protein
MTLATAEAEARAILNAHLEFGRAREESRGGDSRPAPAPVRRTEAVVSHQLFSSGQVVLPLTL